MDKDTRNKKIDETIDKLFDQVCKPEITPEARDEFVEKQTLLNSLRDV